MQLRSFQSRVFDTTDKQKTLRTIISTLQDLGFIVDKADDVLGSVSGTKLDGYQLRMTVTVRPKGETRLLVRANAQYNIYPVEDPEPYQQFFSALEKSMFLTAQLRRVEYIKRCYGISFMKYFALNFVMIHPFRRDNNKRTKDTPF